MNIALTLPWWMIPLFLVITVWAVAVLWPNENYGSLGAATNAMINVICAAGATILILFGTLVWRIWVS